MRTNAEYAMIARQLRREGKQDTDEYRQLVIEWELQQQTAEEHDRADETRVPDPELVTGAREYMQKYEFRSPETVITPKDQLPAVYGLTDGATLPICFIRAINYIGDCTYCSERAPLYLTTFSNLTEQTLRVVGNKAGLSVTDQICYRCVTELNESGVVIPIHQLSRETTT